MFLSPCLCSQDKLIDSTKEFYIGLVNPNAKNIFLGQEGASDPDDTIDFHNTVHFHPNRIDNDVVQPIKALNDVTYNDINGENRIQKQVFHPNSICIQDKCCTFVQTNN